MTKHTQHLTTSPNPNTKARTTSKIQAVRDDLRERRAARAEYRALKTALAGYTSPAEVDELLLIAEAESQDTALVREILAHNLNRYERTHAGRVAGMRYSA